MDDKGEGADIEQQKITTVSECGSQSSSGAKLSHKQWRARLKRERRRHKRQEAAKELAADEGTKSLDTETVDKEFDKLKQQRDEAERAYLHAQWLEREKQALEQWQKTKERERVEKQKREEQEKRIKEEWEAQQKKEKEEQEEKDKIDKEKKSRQEDLLRQATANENKEGDDQPWHNPIVRVVQGKERDRCPFFAKTAACRFGDRCSRTHPETESSTTLLFRGMYSHFELEQGLTGEEYDTDLILEYDDSELYQNFREFYEDIVPEFKAIGRLVQVKVCCNYEPHLRGNVYIQYRREEDAASAFVQFNGRFYGGKQLSCEYVTIATWKSAICGLFGSGRCPKGRNCNFLHVFKNPGNEFWESDRNFDRYRQGNTQNRNREWSQRSEGSSSRRQRNRSRSRERRSRSRERRSRSQERRSRSKSPRKRNRSPRSTRSRRSRSLSKDRYYRSNRKRSRNDRSRSRSRSTSKTRDRKKSKKKRSSSRSLSRGRSKSPKSKSRKRHSCSGSYSRGRSRSSSKSKYQQEEKQSNVDEKCIIIDDIGECEKKLVTESGENNERLENDTNGKVLETEKVKSDRKENSNSSDSEKSTQSRHHHKDKKHKHKKHKHKKHKKVTLEWIEAS